MKAQDGQVDQSTLGQVRQYHPEMKGISNNNIERRTDCWNKSESQKEIIKTKQFKDLAPRGI